MTDISGSIRTLTLADASVSSTVGTRMYSDYLRQSATLPAITYFVVDTVTNQHLTGIANASQARIQIDCYAASRSAANSLADDVRRALQGQNHTLAGTQYILDISLPSGEHHGIVPPEEGSDTRQFITSQDFLVTYRTTTS